MVAIAVLGCGRIGQMHARNVARHPRTTLAGVFDVHAPAAQRVADELGVRVAASPAELFADPAVDAVLIATSTDTHVDLLRQAVAAGKPVLCEKPIDLSLAKVEACARAIAGTRLPIFLGFVRRFDPSHAAVAAAVRDGTIGELHQVIVTSRDPGIAPEAYLAMSGGIFRDMAIHDFDMARFVLREDVDTVFAVGSRLVEPAMMERLGDYDTVSVVMTTGSGKQAIITNSRSATYGYDQRVEAFGSLGMAASQNRRPHATVVSGKGFSEHAAPLLDFFVERYAEAFSAELGAFADAVEGKAPPAVGFEDGRQAQRLAEADDLGQRAAPHPPRGAALMYGDLALFIAGAWERALRSGRRPDPRDVASPRRRGCPGSTSAPLPAAAAAASVPRFRELTADAAPPAEARQPAAAVAGARAGGC